MRVGEEFWVDFHFLIFKGQGGTRMVSWKQYMEIFSFVFFLTSPLTSYGDQILSMHRRKSSAGFSIDVCGIMLVARYCHFTPEVQ